MKISLRSWYIAFIYFFLYFPIAVLIVYSFNDARYSLVWHGFTWRWYQELSLDYDIWRSLLRSLLLGVSASALATYLGLLASVSLYRYRFLGRQVLHGVIFLLIIIPDIVMAIAMLLLFNTFDVPLGFFSLFVAHVTLCLPFAIVTISSRLQNINPHLFEAATDLGASDGKIFRTILIPLLKPAIIAAFLLSFTLSFDDVIISYFVSGPSYEILPLRIFSMVRNGVKPEINALSSITFIITLVVVCVAQMNLRRKT